MTTAHEQIRKALEKAYKLLGYSTVSNEAARMYKEKFDFALALLNSHAVVPREPTPDMLSSNLWIMHDEASAERTGNLKVFGNPIQRTEQYHVRIKEEDQIEMYKAMIQQENPIGCEACDYTGRIECEPDSLNTHPCDTCQPALNKEFQRGFQIAQTVTQEINDEL